MITHEIAHIVESAGHNRAGSPAFSIWGDSKWAEYFQYDLYTGLRMTVEAQRVKDRFSRASDDFPRQGAYWFRDWFLPLWNVTQGPEVMARFLRLLAAEFPTRDGFTYSRRLNWGEYVHFTSAAAGRDMRRQAESAFGWQADWTEQLDAAREAFPRLTYGR